MIKEQTFSTQHILELACAAQRINGNYFKVQESVFDESGKFLYIKHSNKMMMLVTLDHRLWTADPKDAPMPLKVTAEDVAKAEEIKSYFRRLAFAAIAGENDFQTTVNTILNSDSVKSEYFGYVACLPSVYVRDRANNDVKKAARQTEEGYLGEPGDTLFDLDCEILEVIKSKNFPGYNICAIINNKMASFMYKTELQRGPCVIVKAKIKEKGMHWKHQCQETRLNFVKAAQ